MCLLFLKWFLFLFVWEMMIFGSSCNRCKFFAFLKWFLFVWNVSLKCLFGKWWFWHMHYACMQVVLRGGAAAIDVVDKRSHDVHPAPSLEHHPWSSGEEDQGLQVDQDQDLDQDQENRIRRTQSRSGSYFLGLHCIKYFQNVFRAEIHLNEVRYGQQWSIQSRLEMASRDPFKCG